MVLETWLTPWNSNGGARGTRDFPPSPSLSTHSWRKVSSRGDLSVVLYGARSPRRPINASSRGKISFIRRIFDVRGLPFLEQRSVEALFHPFLARKSEKEGKKERKERGGENEGTKISAGRNFYSTRKLVEWKSFPFGCLNGLPFVNC